MSRITRIVPTTVLTVAALALAAPVAQAKPVIAPTGGPNDQTPSVVVPTGGPNDVSPIVRSIHAANANAVRDIVHDTPLKNPVKTPSTLGVGLMHASTVQSPVDSGRRVAVPASDGFDWTAAAIGAGLGGILMVMLAAGVSFRRRGQLAA
jgi:hypothetical protein